MGVSPGLVCLTDVKDEHVGFGDAWGHGVCFAGKVAGNYQMAVKILRGESNKADESR